MAKVDIPSDRHYLVETLTKRTLASDIAKIFDVLGWFSKILLQKLWQHKIDWDDDVYLLSGVTGGLNLDYFHLLRCYLLKGAQRSSAHLHGFCGVSKEAFAAVASIHSFNGCKW